MLGIKVKRCLLFGNNRQLRVQPVGFPLNDTDMASFFGLINSLFLSCGEAYTPQRKKILGSLLIYVHFFCKNCGYCNNSTLLSNKKRTPYCTLNIETRKEKII